ncbi:MAG: ATP-binding protein [Deltaproteobacteria bacterium]|nr:ATP-binding protein [Deltaproteobacteria bacterium]
MIPRNIAFHIKKYAREYPLVALVGPRQSGKTTLVRHLFPGHTYLSLENIDLRHRAQNDPRGFLADYNGPVIIDEAQRVPDLFSYLQEQVDMQDIPGRYVLTGSQQFLLMEKISQSLAGRIVTFKLMPFSVTELCGFQSDKTPADIFAPKKRQRSPLDDQDIYSLLFTGFYPRIHDKHLTASKWLENYVLTYVERDIRNLVNVSNLMLFENFLKMCAGFCGQLLNYASLSNALGVSQPTIKSWISLLETSGIIFLLRPHYRNFSKRLIKTPKLYFVDTGLLCFLLSIRKPDELKNHPLYGNIFENFVISEFYKRISHVAETPPLYFWRDKTGNEIDLIVEQGTKLLPIEIKSSRTFSTDFVTGLEKWCRLKGNDCESGFVVYGGDELIGKSSMFAAVPWWRF